MREIKFRALVKKDIERYWCDTCCRLGIYQNLVESIYTDGQWSGYIANTGSALITLEKHKNEI